MPASLQANLEAVRQAITSSADSASRDPSAVTLVAVTKTVAVERIREAITLGLRIFGENRVQEALPKMDEIGPANIDWHLVGHLQTNKIKFLEGRFQMVQSVDSAGLAEALDRRLQSALDVLVEVNVAEEPQKTGALPADLPAIAPTVSDPEQVRPIFRRLRSLRDETSHALGMPLPVLSMGMTDDYPVAVEEGATMLRLG